jgi:hypothetical protein
MIASAIAASDAATPTHIATPPKCRGRALSPLFGDVPIDYLFNNKSGVILGDPQVIE